ncbi:MAG: hypothetical protein WC971_08250 [Coriobacteriia bacterium]
MRQFRRLFSVLTAALLLVALLPAVAGAEAFPGAALPASGFTGSFISGDDADQVFQVTLAAGQSIRFWLLPSDTNVAGTDFDMYLFPPGVTGVDTASQAVASSREAAGEVDGFVYTVPQGGGGTYYLDIYAASIPQAGQSTGSYRILYGDTATLSISAPGTTLAYGGTVAITGRMLDGAGAPIAGRAVTLYTSPDNVTWSAVATLTSTTGSYATALRGYRRTYFYLGFAGDDTYALAVSPIRVVTSRAALTAPAVPSIVARGRRYTAWGTLRPRHRAGSNVVRVTLYRLESGRWRQRLYTTSAAQDVAGGSRYGIWFTIAGAGRWKVLAVHSDTDHAATSVVRYFTVR